VADPHTIDPNLIVDANGHVIGSLSKVRAYRNSNQLINDTSLTTIQFANETFDLLGDYNTGTYRFVAPVDGFYRVDVQLFLPANAVNWFCYINHNGSQIVEVSKHGSGAGTSTITFGDLIQMTASQYVQIEVLQFSGGGLNIGGGSNHTFLTVSRLL